LGDTGDSGDTNRPVLTGSNRVGRLERRGSGSRKMDSGPVVASYLDVLDRDPLRYATWKLDHNGFFLNPR